MSDALREAAARALDDAINDDGLCVCCAEYTFSADTLPLVDAVLVVLAERERLLRERIEALRDEPHTPAPCPAAHTADDAYRRVLAVFDA